MSDTIIFTAEEESAIIHIFYAFVASALLVALAFSALGMNPVIVVSTTVSAAVVIYLISSFVERKFFLSGTALLVGGTLIGSSLGVILFDMARTVFLSYSFFS